MQREPVLIGFSFRNLNHLQQSRSAVGIADVELVNLAIGRIQHVERVFVDIETVLPLPWRMEHAQDPQIVFRIHFRHRLQVQRGHPQLPRFLVVCHAVRAAAPWRTI